MVIGMTLWGGWLDWWLFSFVKKRKENSFLKKVQEASC